jgi:hypothetical protein
MSQPWPQLLSDPIVGATAILLLVAVLGGGSWHKLLDRIAFRETLRDYQILPEAAVGPVATIVPLVEFLACILLVVPGTRATGASIAALLLAGYALAIGLNLARGRTDIDCGCSWGGGTQPISAWLIGRNALLIAIAGVAANTWSARTLGIIDGLVILAAASFALLIYHAADRLIANQALLSGMQRSR